jgi:hypothetical protein
MLLVCIFLHKQAAYYNIAAAPASASAPTSTLTSTPASASTSAPMLLC